MRHRLFIVVGNWRRRGLFGRVHGGISGFTTITYSQPSVVSPIANNALYIRIVKFLGYIFSFDKNHAKLLFTAPKNSFILFVNHFPQTPSLCTYITQYRVPPSEPSRTLWNHQTQIQTFALRPLLGIMPHKRQQLLLSLFFFFVPSPSRLAVNLEIYLKNEEISSVRAWLFRAFSGVAAGSEG